MTHLELVAEVGSGPMDIVNMYFKGMLTIKELASVLGRRRAELVLLYASQQNRAAAEAACCRERV